MSDFLGDRECVTHHACDCIQTEVERLRAEVEEVREAGQRGIEAMVDQVRHQKAEAERLRRVTTWQSLRLTEAEAQVERLTTALREIADATYSGDPYDGGLLWQHVERLQGVAEAALLDGAA